LANNYTGVWDYQTQPQTWREYLPNQPAFLSELASLQPDKAYWLDVPNAAQLLFQEQEKKILFYHADHLGSTNVVTDLAGDVVESTEFYPFGRARHEYKNGFAADYQYTGKELDKETGLMYYEARYMDAVTGRFVSVDPLAVAPPELMLLNPQFIHAYGYAGNNPIAYRDRDGKVGDIVVGAIVGGIMGGVSKAIEIQNLKNNKPLAHLLRYPNKAAVARSIAIATSKGALLGAGGAATALIGGSAIVAGLIKGGIDGAIESALSTEHGLKDIAKGALKGAALSIIPIPDIPDTIGYIKDGLSGVRDLLEKPKKSGKSLGELMSSHDPFLMEAREKKFTPVLWQPDKAAGKANAPGYYTRIKEWLGYNAAAESIEIREQE
jgi:RHS repeat-associated protein